MLDNKGFDLWADGYDKAVGLSDGEKSYPFAGYKEGLAGPLLNNSYDFIIATYSLHHLTDEKIISFIRTLSGLLNDGGAVLIGDVAFATRQELESCRLQEGDGWDSDEIYFVYEEMRDFFPKMEFERFSHCAGVLTLEKDE